jgi:hypothetical protein
MARPDDIELANRRNGSFEVRLLWSRDGDVCTVSVEDEGTGEHFEIEVTHDRALDAFYHPFAYTPVAYTPVSSSPA